nr:gfo/Idh/MocA family oxidoreductase [Flammeovirgaceae bacterium]
MGVLAVRLQGLNKELLWDGEKMEFTNLTDNDSIKMVVKDSFEMKDGRPHFQKSMTDPISAKPFAKELIKHTYRAPWKLPDMPK